LIGVGFVLTGLGLIAQRLLVPAREPWLAMEADFKTRKAAIGLALMLGGIVLYIVASEEIGFLPTAAFVLWANLWWFWRRPGAAFLLSLCTVLVMQAFFGSFMQVPLPAGLLEPVQGMLSWK
jgi:putative tricarboxylic transport membrane protein